MFCFSIRPSLWLGLFFFLPDVASGGVPANPCATCHPHEVAGYSHSAMAHSLRRPADELAGSFFHAPSGTKFTIHSEKDGLWQRMERDERALALGPDSAVAEEDAGRAWMQAGKLDKAVDHFERAVKA